MAEPTGTYNFADLWQRAAQYWKNSKNPAADDVERLKDVVNDAYSRFLSAFDWTFLSPAATLDTTANQDYSALADNFGELEGVFAYDSSEGVGVVFAERTSQWIEEHQGLNGAPTGVPTYFAIEATTFTAATGQRWRVIWYPTPDAVYTLNYRYAINHAKMTSDAEYPMGGTRHSYTILCAAMAQVELDLKRITDGYWNQQYMQVELPKSMRRDLALRPRTLDDAHTGRATEPALRNTVEHS